MLGRVGARSAPRPRSGPRWPCRVSEIPWRHDQPPRRAGRRGPLVSVSSHPAPLSWPVSAINLGADVGGQLPVNGTNRGQPAWRSPSAVPRAPDPHPRHGAARSSSSSSTPTGIVRAAGFPTPDRLRLLPTCDGGEGPPERCPPKRTRARPSGRSAGRAEARPPPPRIARRSRHLAGRTSGITTLQLFRCTAVDFEVPIPHPIPDELLGSSRAGSVCSPSRPGCGCSTGCATARRPSRSWRMTWRPRSRTSPSTLAMLAEAGVLARRRQGTRVFYRIGDEEILGLCERHVQLRSSTSCAGSPP